jgi:hypothetical protein
MTVHLNALSDQRTTHHICYRFTSYLDRHGTNPYRLELCVGGNFFPS